MVLVQALGPTHSRDVSGSGAPAHAPLFHAHGLRAVVGLRDDVCKSRCVRLKSRGRKGSSSSGTQPTPLPTKKMREDCLCEASTARVEEALPVENPTYDVFLGGSCGNTVWRRQLVIPFLKKRAISYYDPQRSVWSENMIYEESIAKENSSLFLFVIDPATVNATSFLEIAYFAARKNPKLVVVFLGKTEWTEKAHPDDLPDRNRTCQLLDRILDVHDVPMLYSIEEALAYIEEEVIGSKSWRDAVRTPSQRIPYISLKTQRVLKIAGRKAAGAWNTVKNSATTIGLASAVSSIVLLSGHLLLPQISLLVILLPLIMLNMLFFTAYSRWQSFRARRPRSVVDSSLMVPRAAAIPSPRLATVVTPLNSTTTYKNSVTRSKRFCDELMVDDGSTSFLVPETFRRVPNGKIRIPESKDSIALELVSSSLDHVDWVTSDVTPLMDGKGTRYSRALASRGLLPDMRMNCLRAWAAQYKHFLYHITDTNTFLSGMVEIAYMLGHSDWQVTVCVPKESETLQCPAVQEDERERAARRRRNDCYQIAYCYLKDMAKRRQCRVFSDLDEAVRYAAKISVEDV